MVKKIATQGDYDFYQIVEPGKKMAWNIVPKGSKPPQGGYYIRSEIEKIKGVTFPAVSESVKLTESRILGIPSIESIEGIIKGNRPYAFISACDAKVDFNTERTEKLKAELQKYDYYVLYGWWPEEETNIDIYEYSFLVMDISKEDALRLGKGEFIPMEQRRKPDGRDAISAQDAILYSDPEDNYVTAINPSTGTITGYFSKDSVTTTDLDHGWSQVITDDEKIRGKKWALVFLGESEPTDEGTTEEPEETETEEIIEPEVETEDDLGDMEEVDEEVSESTEVTTDKKTLIEQNLMKRRKVAMKAIMDLSAQQI